MRAVARGKKPPPSALAKRNRKGKTELETVREHMAQVLAPGTARTAFEFKAYKEQTVKDRLDELFHGKCAYCESFYASQAPVDVEHYRPKGAVEGADFPGYWWIAMEWSNLLPSCIDCNRRRKQKAPIVSPKLGVLYRQMSTGKKDSFPIAGVRVEAEETNFLGEEALLLDPTRDTPSDHFEFYIKSGQMSGLAYPKSLAGDPALAAVNANLAAVAAHAEANSLSVRGAVSIQVYGLNRLKLVHQRAEVLQRLRFLEYIVVRIGHVMQMLEVPHLVANPEVRDALSVMEGLQIRTIDEMARQADAREPYSVIAKAYLDDFLERLRSGPLPAAAGGGGTA